MEDGKWRAWRAFPSSIFHLPSSCLILATLLFIAAPARGAWFDPQWRYRRPIEVTWSADSAEGGELAVVDFNSAGHCAPDATDVRVALEQGHLVPSHVLMSGPGDGVRVVFQLEKGQKRYYAYFGNPKPPAPPAGTEDVKYTAGLLLETRRFAGGPTDGFEHIVRAWERSGPELGKTFIDRPFLGVDPFGDYPQTISKISGRITAPVDGKYTFAAAADSRGALFLDGQQVVFAPSCPGDIRFNKTIDIKRGSHDFVFYQVHNGGEGRFSVGWRRPDMDKVDVIAKQAFGVVYPATAGALEAHGQTLTADFNADYLGECFVENDYSHRYRFTAQAPKAAGTHVTWDFGDGLSATGTQVEHVFVTDGLYPIRVTVQSGGKEDSQTSRLAVSRDFAHLDKPATDEPLVHAKIVAGYAVEQMPLRWLPPAVMLELRVAQRDAAAKMAERLATETSHPNAALAFDAMEAVTKQWIAGGDVTKAAALWAKVSVDSDLQPRAGRYYGSLLLWYTADFEKAVAMLEPLAANGYEGIKRMYAQALILDGQAEKGKDILSHVPAGDFPQRQAARSGAMARTIEYYIEQRDWETGESDWEQWDARYPDTFLEGYSVLLRTKLMELRKDNAAAAKVAEAFADAVPDSSYAPSLLDRASKLLARTDAKKSAELRDTLKKRYPEDPLSQDTQAKE